jgi:uroporphyrinogen-III synthase
MRILLTRSQPQSARTAAALRAAGHEVIEAPLFIVTTVADADVGRGPWSAVVMTSASAARALASHPHRDEIIRLPAVVVGERSAAAAHAAGFTEVEAVGGNVRALAAHLAKRAMAADPILYLAGAHLAADLPSLLDGSPCGVTTVVVYRADAVRGLPASTTAMLKADGIDAVLHFSRRGAETLLALASAASCLVNVLNCKHFCLSPQVAEALTQGGAAGVFAAESPNEASLIALVGKA